MGGARWAAARKAAAAKEATADETAAKEVAAAAAANMATSANKAATTANKATATNVVPNTVFAFLRTVRNVSIRLINLDRTEKTVFHLSNLFLSRSWGSDSNPAAVF